MGYATLTNTITTAFQDFANTNSYVVRYDNDPRDTPTDDVWLEVSVEFDTTESRDFATSKYRTTGVLRVTITDNIGKGIYQVLAISDLIEAQFSNTKITDVLFRTAMISKRGRTSDNISNNRSGRQINSNQAANAGGGDQYQVDVTIPFQYDFTS
ncbi:hypothetical protein LCGC14_0425760 [marine sediment metagenome]|uniref:Uncharacterized protein n=1 Tax=marine sediment metagenome TaxID=412755 RepID=A0A0F9SVR6_9ZZZZ